MHAKVINQLYHGSAHVCDNALAYTGASSYMRMNHGITKTYFPLTFSKLQREDTCNTQY